MADQGRANGDGGRSGCLFIRAEGGGKAGCRVVRGGMIGGGDGKAVPAGPLFTLLYYEDGADRWTRSRTSRVSGES